MAELYRRFLSAVLRQDSERARILLQDRRWQWEDLFGFANEQYFLPAFSTSGLSVSNI
jgi:hypothetical protein